MGLYDRYSEYPQQRRRRMLLGDDNNAVVNLFIINIFFFLLLFFIQVIYFVFQKDNALYESQVLKYFALPAQLTQLTEKPWVLLVYMFCHTRVWDIIANMLWLWAFGTIMQDLAGNNKLIPVYIYGGLAGAVFFILSYYSIPPIKPFIGSASIIGANASTMAVAVATSTLAPDYRFFRNFHGGISIWVLTAIFILIDFAGVAGMGAAYSLAHLGGALAGFFFIYFLHKGYDGSLWMNQLYSWFMNLFNPKKISVKPHKPSVKEKVFYNATKPPYTKTTHITQERVDEILDKINQKGYHFLSDEEKNILKRASEEGL